MDDFLSISIDQLVKYSIKPFGNRSRHCIRSCVDGVHCILKVPSGWRLLPFSFVQFLLIPLPFILYAFVYQSDKMILQAHTSLEETHRMTAVRKAYQRAIVTPTHHIEQLWRDYENFENSVSRALVIFRF